MDQRTTSVIPEGQARGQGGAGERECEPAEGRERVAAQNCKQ